MLMSGLLGQMMMRSASRIASSTPGAGLADSTSIKANAAHDGLGAALHQIFLKMQRAFVGFNDRRHGLVAHRKDARLHAEGHADGFGCVRERSAFGQHRGAVDVRGEVAIAKIEPVDPAEDGEPLERVKRLPAKAPAFRGVDDAGQRIGDDVEVRRNFQTMKRDVVASIDDGCEARGINDIVESEQQLGGANATGQSGNRDLLCGFHAELGCRRRPRSYTARPSVPARTARRLRIADEANASRSTNSG